VFIKFTNEDKLKEILEETEGKCVYKHDTGEISQVNVEIAGMGTKRFRIAELPPEVKETTIRGSLNKYGETANIRNETWAAAYRYKVSNGIKVVELKLKKSHAFLHVNSRKHATDVTSPDMCKWNAQGGNDWTKIRATHSLHGRILSRIALGTSNSIGQTVAR